MEATIHMTNEQRQQKLASIEQDIMRKWDLENTRHQEAGFGKAITDMHSYEQRAAIPAQQCLNKVEVADAIIQTFSAPIGTDDENPIAATSTAFQNELTHMKYQYQDQANILRGWMLACASHDRHTRGWPRSGLALAGEALMFELALRAARAAALLLHELSHLAAAAAWLLPAARLRLRAPLGSGAAEQ
ncbi:unnamed protein product, partial [Prorocentrum cordatum]